jgi:branched-subunit amino acid ABC-type transport system permease component
MVGAFLTFTFTKTLGLPFWVAIVLAALSVAVIGLVMEIFLFRRVYGRPPADQLLLTFAMVLIIHDLVRLAYGSNLRSVSRPPLLAGAVFLGDVIFPSYYIFIIAVGVAVLLGFWAFLHRTRLGKTIRAAVGNREMVACLGKPLPWLFTAAFAAGVFVDGLAGAIAAPLGGIRLGMDFDIIILAFATVIVGGFGSLPGTALAAFIIGEAYAFGIWLMPAIALSLPFIIMAAVLIVRPWGLLGRSGGGEL